MFKIYNLVKDGNTENLENKRFNMAKYSDLSDMFNTVALNDKNYLIGANDGTL